MTDTPQSRSDLAGRLGALGLPPETATAIAGAAKTAKLRRGAVAFRPGDEPAHWLLVLSGRLRVSLVAETGREIVLYRVGPGESCVLTTSNLLACTPQSAEALVEEDAEAVLLEAATFRRLLGASAAFRDDALAAYASRLSELVHVLEDTVFHALPQRLARAILARAGEGGVARATHQDLAAELGTAREVITRTLNAFSRDGLVTLARGEILVRDRERLTTQAQAG
ncbi:Crp/Fnr family transcriptional regulator [Salinarimonas sp.]|uniref:Crp/Fnr family transcriptional regulator n=1 Tax=Salinarimonas sp. TaxID=2766526 RepID=UPI0032D9491C